MKKYYFLVTLLLGSLYAMEQPDPQQSSQVTLEQAVAKRDAKALVKLLSKQTWGDYLRHQLWLLNGVKDQELRDMGLYALSLGSRPVDSRDCVASVGYYAAMGNVGQLSRYNFNLPDKNIRVDSLSEIHVLHVAAYGGYPEVIQLLIEKGVNEVDVQDKQGKTPLHIAAENGHAAAVELLILHNASVNIIDNAGNTPLRLAAENGHSKVVQILLEHGAGIAASRIVNVPEAVGILALPLAVAQRTGKPADQPSHHDHNDPRPDPKDYMQNYAKRNWFKRFLKEKVPLLMPSVAVLLYVGYKIYNERQVVSKANIQDVDAEDEVKNSTLKAANGTTLNRPKVVKKTN